MAICDAHASLVGKRKRRRKSKGDTPRGDHGGCNLAEDNPSTENNVSQEFHKEMCLNMEPEMGPSHLEKNEQTHNTLQYGEASRTSVSTKLNVEVLKEDLMSTSPNGDFCSAYEKDNSLVHEDPNGKNINMVKRDDENTETVNHSTPSSHVETKKSRKRKRQREKRRSLKSAINSCESPTEDKKKVSLLSHPHEVVTIGHLKNIATEEVMNGILLEKPIDSSISEKIELLSASTKESSTVISGAHRSKDLEMPEMGQSPLEVNLSKEKNDLKHNTLQCGETSGTSVLTKLNVKVLKEKDVTSTSPNQDLCYVDEKYNSSILDDPDRKRINMVKKDDENTETVDHSTPSSHVESKKLRKRKRKRERKRSLKSAKTSLEPPTEDRKKLCLLSDPHEAETTGHLKHFAKEDVMNEILLEESIDCSISEKTKLSLITKESSMAIENIEHPTPSSRVETKNMRKRKRRREKQRSLKSAIKSCEFPTEDRNKVSQLSHPHEVETIGHLKNFATEEVLNGVLLEKPIDSSISEKIELSANIKESSMITSDAQTSLKYPTEDRKKLCLLSDPHEAETTGHLKHFAKEDVMNEILLEESIDCSISEKTELSSITKESSMVIENTLMTKNDDDCLETKECLAQSKSDYTPGQTKRKRKKGLRKRKLVDTLEGSLNSDVEDNKKNVASNCSNEVDATSLHEHSTNDPVKNVLVESIKQKVPHLLACDVTNDNIGAILEKNSSSRISSSSNERDAVGFLKKKLLILDVNGLLVDFVPYHPAGYTPDIVISRKAVFKRPFCDDFLQFCFERFEVGIWSSRTRKNLNMLVDFLMRDSKHKLLFCWDQSHCTTTGFTTVENDEKPLVLKELKKIWDTLEPNLPWRKGEYNASNTLLLDDSPYKALRNPANTAVFPTSYQFSDSDDSSLGPGGDLRTYLEGVSTAENVQIYVKQNPFGQKPISESNPSWKFYQKVINSKKKK